MKFLIAGLGNMHHEYFGTRHNIGFDVADAIAKQLDIGFSNSTLAHVASGKSRGKQIILIKPTTYMNLSGKAVKHWMQKENIPMENVLVVLDDLNIEFGSIRIRPSGTDGGHNGLKDIDLQLNSNKYARLRIGIRNNFGKGRQVNYVLGKWNEKELQIFPEIIKLAADASLSFCFAGLANTMNSFNNKKIEPDLK